MIRTKNKWKNILNKNSLDAIRYNIKFVGFYSNRIFR